MKNEHALRFRIVQVVMALIGVTILFQIVYIQNSAQAKAIMEEKNLYDGWFDIVQPPYGEIYDRNGHLLAGNKPVYQVGVDIKTIKDPQTLALAASVHLGLDYATILEQVSNPADGVVYINLANYVPAETAKILMDMQTKADLKRKNTGDTTLPSLAGMMFTPRLLRSNPENSLASNILGFITPDNMGWFGIEEKYSNLLVVPSVKVWIPTNPKDAMDMPAIQPGATLILTLNREIQAATEQILDDALDTYDAEAGTIIVENPQTGEILAMAVTPRLNLNEYWRYSEVFPNQLPFNRAISQSYEPGSVLKILTMAAALDTGTVQPGTTFFDTGSIVVGGAVIQNWDRKAWGLQDMTGCLQHSLNVCLAWVATQLGNDKFYTYMQNFGLGHNTNIDLAGENPGRLKLPGDVDWYPVELGTNAFGQGVAVTPIQMVMAASAIANNGQMVYPHLLKTMIQGGQVHNFTAPQIVGNPITAETAQTLTGMLAVSLEKEASLALVEGYRIAGKTGTAQIPNPNNRYDTEQTNVSFVGWGPVDDPQFLVYIWLEKPTTSSWGSEVAAPVFRQVVQRLVVLLNIPPDAIRLQLNAEQ